MFGKLLTRLGIRSRKGRETAYGYVFILPWLVGIVCFVLGPLVFSFITSFADYNMLTVDFIGLGNYKKMFFKDQLFWKSLGNTLVYSLLNVPLVTVGGVIVAVILNKSIWGLRTFRTIYYLPSIMVGVGTYFLWMLLLDPANGLVNTVLGLIGIKGPAWLTDPAWTKPAIILMHLWGLGGQMLLYLARLQSIPQDYYEAASLDGAGAFRKFTTITVPLLSPIIFYNLTIGIIGAFQVFQEGYIYKGITFWSPNVNIFRDPRWGRGQETYGEDPYLTGCLGAAFVEGLQGDDPRYLKTAACAKHFAVHSGPEKVRHEFDAVVSPKDMEETYLPAFRRLVDCGVEGFMGAYNRTNGEPCCGSRTLLAELLRGKWGFQGYITSDCWAVSDFHLHHGVTVTPTESVQLALGNGCDLNCGNMYAYIMQAYTEGKITEEMIRTSCTRLLTTRMKLGMFDRETPFDAISMDVVDCEAHQAVNEEMTRASMVLLKNNGILPLDKKKIKTIAVIGPNANSINALEGNYHGTANRYITVLEGIRAEFADARVNYCEGSHLYEYKLEDPGYAGDRLGEVKGMTDEADVVILVTGLDETIEGEEMADKEMGGDKADLYLPQCQQDLVRTACGRETPVVLVNLSGSAVDFAYGNDHADAIIQAWYPGGLGGKVIAELLAGKYSPSGRLPVTFYHNENSLPAFTDYSMDGRTYKFLREDPLFPFGFGLSYTSFAYSGLDLPDSFQAGEKVSGSVRVKNTGAVSGREVVQVYVRDLEASVRVPHHKLCHFHSVFLQPGEEREAVFEIDAEQFEIIKDDGSRAYEAGVFRIFAGGSQPDACSERLAGCRTVHRDITMR